MRRILFFLLPLAGFLVLSLFLLRGLWLNPREVPSPLIGKPAPAFERPLLLEPERSLSTREMAGQVWVLNPREVPSPLIGKPAPAFERPLLLEPERSLSTREMAGQVWVLNVFASWCVPCRQEHPLWNELSRQKSVTLVGLNYKDTPEAAKKWLRELGDPYLTIVKDLDGRVGIDYGVYGVPETFVIDKAGIIRYKHIGPVTPEAMAEKIVPLVKQLQQ